MTEPTRALLPVQKQRRSVENGPAAKVGHRSVSSTSGMPAVNVPPIAVPLTETAVAREPSPLRRNIVVANTSGGQSFPGLRTAPQTGAGVIRRTFHISLDRETKKGDKTPEDVFKRLSTKGKGRYQALDGQKGRTFAFHSLETLEEYCEGGDTSLYKMYESMDLGAEPVQKPQKPKLKTDTKYESSKQKMADYFEVPQTPYRDGDKRQNAKIVGQPRMKTLMDDVASSRTRPEMNVKKDKTTNVFQYELQLTYRAMPLEELNGRWQELRDKEVLNLYARGRSPLYQSSGKAFPSGDTKPQKESRQKLPEASLRQEVRSGVSQAVTTGFQFEQFTPTSVFAFDLRDGKNDLRTVLDKDSTKKQGYALADNQISSMCFHSETQALGATERELPPIVEELIKDLVRQAVSFGPVELSFNSLQVMGASHPNTVCGNACKPALSALLDTIIDKVAARVTALKDPMKAKSIYLRNSQYFIAHMSVAAPEEFEGYGTGAVDIDFKKTLKHGVVTEFPPELMIVDNPKRIAKKAETAKKRAAKADSSKSKSNTTSKKAKGVPPVGDSAANKRKRDSNQGSNKRGKYDK